MRIALFMSSIKDRNSGVGGHYRSLLSYYSQLKGKGDIVQLMHYNELNTSILDDKAPNLLADVVGFNNFRHAVSSILKDNNIDVILSFGEDIQSRTLRYYCWKNGVKFVQIIAGGPNRIFPMFFTNCIYFSTENLNNPRDFSKNTFLISNRIDEYSVDQKLIDELEMDYPKKEINILRVSRIHKAYLEPFFSAINLHIYLSNQGVDVQTHLVGYIQDESCFNALKKRIAGLKNIFIITNKKYTKDVKKLMTYYDIAIAIGRGFGEAASKRLLVLGYNSVSDIPVVINEDNYEKMRATNFSPRSKVSKIYEVDNFPELFLPSSNLRKKYTNFIYEKYVQDYSSSKIKSKIEKIIGKSEEEELPSIIISLFFISLSELRHRFKDALKKWS